MGTHHHDGAKLSVIQRAVEPSSITQLRAAFSLSDLVAACLALPSFVKGETRMSRSDLITFE